MFYVFKQTKGELTVVTFFMGEVQAERYCATHPETFFSSEWDFTLHQEEVISEWRIARRMALDAIFDTLV